MCDRNASGEQLMNNNDDAYSGLMTSRERQWIVNIQLNQLKCENPFLDDYYYTVFNQNRSSIEQSKTSTQSHDGESSETKLKVNTETTQLMRYSSFCFLIKNYHIKLYTYKYFRVLTRKNYTKFTGGNVWRQQTQFQVKME